MSHYAKKSTKSTQNKALFITYKCTYVEQIN